MRFLAGDVCFGGGMGFVYLLHGMADGAGGAAAARSRVESQFAFLGRPAPWFLLGAIMLGNGGVFCWYSYINPLLVHVSGFAPSSMTYLMVVAGAGMVVGNLLAGELADRCGAVPVAAAFIAVMAVSLLLIVFCRGGAGGFGGADVCCRRLSVRRFRSRAGADH